MDLDTVIRVEKLSKSFRVGHEVPGAHRYTALRDVLARNARDLLRKTRDMVHGRPIVQGDEIEEFWALKDVDFEVKRGDRVGIIGRNGAGKSTLLKILSRITEPTRGRVSIDGRVASLLEVGTGFHPELTGRENIFLNGAILGMKRAEILQQFDRIVDFAEVERFLDTPVKRYSSGMYVRLAFAVAAHLQPEILIVDEVLAVGDAQFQKKCLGKMEEVGKEGRTVLFVSHNLAAVGALTNRSILLARGTVQSDDSTDKVITEYLRNSATQSPHYTASKNLDAYVTEASVKTSDGGSVQRGGALLVLEFVIRVAKPVRGLCFSFQLVNEMGIPVAHCWQYERGCDFGDQIGTYLLRFVIPRARLNVGDYAVTFHVSGPPGGPVFERVVDACHFSVEMVGRTTLFGWRRDACTYHEDYECEVTRLPVGE